MKRNLFLTVLIIGVAMIFAFCGGDAGESKTPEPAKEAQPEAKAADTQPAGDNEGVAVAKEILATFDKALAEVVALTKDKPEPAELKPKLETLYTAYDEKMKALNVKYLALKEKDIALFGACNSYLGENRGKHVFEKDKVLGIAVAYYGSEKGDKELAQLLSKEIIRMLETAVKR